MGEALDAQFLLRLAQGRLVVGLARAHHSADEHVVEGGEDEFGGGAAVDEDVAVCVSGLDEDRAVAEALCVGLASWGLADDLVVFVDYVEDFVSWVHAPIKQGVWRGVVWWSVRL